MAKLLRRTIHKMSPKDREIFLRHYYYLQTAEEISHILGIPRSTVLSRLRRGRTKLEKSLAKEDLF
jgi:RNA polymerase sigma-70 factor (ECF subfamily)